MERIAVFRFTLYHPVEGTKCLHCVYSMAQVPFAEDAAVSVRLL